MRIKLIAVSMAIIIATLIVYGALGISYKQHEREQRDIAQQVEQLGTALQPDTEPDTPTHWDQLLAEAQTSLVAAEQSPFPALMSNTEVTDTILETAQRYHVTISLGTDPASVRKIGDYEYRISRFRITAKGNLTDILSFMSNLESGAIETSYIDQAALSESEDEWTANLNMVVYTKPRLGM